MYSAIIIGILSALIAYQQLGWRIDYTDRESVSELLTITPVGNERTKNTQYSRDQFGTGWIKPNLDMSYPESTRTWVLEEYSDNEDRIWDEYADNYVKNENIDIDHLLPLSAAWDLGASHWDYLKRISFANDVDVNLLPTQASINRDKSDSTVGSWLPPARKTWCTYSYRYLVVLHKYDLALTQQDHDVIKYVCNL